MKTNKIIKQLFLSTIVLFLFNCKNTTKEENILPKESMINIFTAIHQLESEISTRNLTPDSAKLYYYAGEKEIFSKFDTDSSVVHKSFNYYLAKGEDLDNIYSQIVDSLGLIQTKNHR